MEKQRAPTKTAEGPSSHPDRTRRSVTFEELKAEQSDGVRPSKRATKQKASPSRARPSSTSSARSNGSERSSSAAAHLIAESSVSGSRSSPPGSESTARRPSTRTGRKAGARGSGGALILNKPPPDPLAEITARALESLSMPALKSQLAAANRASAKEKRAAMNKVQSAVLRAHQNGAKAMDVLFTEESEAMFGLFLQESLKAHSREITALQRARAEEKALAQKRLDHAAETTGTLLAGVTSLLEAARAAGADVCAESGVLTNGPYRGQNETAAHHDAGRPMPEVRNPQSSWLPSSDLSKTHRPQRLTDSERDALHAIRIFFGQVTDGVRGDTAVGSPSDPAQPRELPTVPPAVLGVELTRLKDALVALLDQLRMRDVKQQERITAQERVLDEHATRLKRADDLLRDTVEQDHCEASYTVQRLIELDASLRARMDAVEEGTQLALSALIADKTDVCLSNNVYSDRAALQQYREDRTHHLMTRMEGLHVEQAAMLRTVQEALVAMNRRVAHRGREEKVVDAHTTLPTSVRALLEETCDRDTLVRFLCHVTLHSDEATHLLLGAIAEYAQYLQAHPSEAEAVREAARTHAAVSALVTKMYEESLISRNPHAVQPSLTNTLEHIVSQYNEFMGFRADHATAALRQADHQATLRAQRQMHRPGTGGFFDEAVPLPASMVEADGGLKPNPYSATLYQPRPPERILPCAKTLPQSTPTAPMSGDRPGASASRAAVSASTHPVGGPAGQTDERAVARVVLALQQAYPSQQDPRRAATLSVVGDGRWGGLAPAHNARTEEQEGVRSGKDALARTQPALPRLNVRRPSAVTAAMSSHAVARSVPAPVVPPRKLLTAHVLSEYDHSVEDALAAVTNSRATARSVNVPSTGITTTTEATPAMRFTANKSAMMSSGQVNARGDDASAKVEVELVPGAIRTTFAPLVSREDTTSEASRLFATKGRQLAYQDGDSEYIEKLRQTFSVFAAPHVNYT